LSPYFFPKFARLKGSDSKKTGVAWYRTPRQNAPGVPPLLRCQVCPSEFARAND